MYTSSIINVAATILAFTTSVTALPSSEPADVQTRSMSLIARDDGDYNPSYTGSWCLGNPYEVGGVTLTCPPSAFSWALHLPGWGSSKSPNFPQTCAEGLLDNLRGRCGVISAWGCKSENNNADSYVTFNTDIECQYNDVQDAFQAANGGKGGLWCIRGACGNDDPLENGSEGVLNALEGIIEAAGKALP